MRPTLSSARTHRVTPAPSSANHVSIYQRRSLFGSQSHSQVGFVVFPSLGSSVHLATAQTVASKPIKNTPRRAHLL
jgi:hypothetical protein